MALTDLAIRAAGLRARPPRPVSSRPPVGALANPTFNGLPHQPLWPAYEGPNAVRMAARNVYAAKCIERIAGDISALPFVAGNMASRTPRPTSRMQQLLGPAPGSPNPMWSAAKLWKYWTRQWLILGKFAAVKERDAQGRIVALWPLMAQYVVPVVAPVGSPGYFEKYKYGTQGAPGYREFQPDEIMYVWSPSDEDVRLPQAPLKLASYGIKISTLLDQYDDAFLSNGGVPAHLVITPTFENDGPRTSFRDQFRRKFGGPSNANKVMFAEVDETAGEYGATGGGSAGGGGGGQSVRVETIGTTQKDAQMDVMRDGRIADMCVAFGVPLSLLGDSRLAKFTNMANDRANYYQGTIRDHLTAMQDGVNVAIGGQMDGPNDLGWFDTSAVPELRPAPKLPAAELQAAVDGGTITPNEMRAELGWPALDDSDADVARVRTAVAPVAALPAGAPDVEPAADDTAPTRAAAVRLDLAGVVRQQLAVELDAVETEIRARLDGKRGGRKRASAQLDIGLAYDAAHWRDRAATNLGPALRAAGVDQPEEWVEDITDAVFDGLSGLGPDDAWDSVLDVDGLIAVLRPGAPALMLAAA